MKNKRKNNKNEKVPETEEEFIKYFGEKRYEIIKSISDAFAYSLLLDLFFYLAHLMGTKVPWFIYITPITIIVMLVTTLTFFSITRKRK